MLAACGADPRAESKITAATLDRATPTLDADVDLRFSRAMLDALDRGIPLTLELRVDAGDLEARRALQLRYLPLARRYALRDVASGDERTYARRTQLLAALDHWRVYLPPEWRALEPGAAVVARVSLDHDTLPGALRMPALIRPEWQLSTAEFTWRVPG